MGTGKQLTKGLKEIKFVTGTVNPMGSNYDYMEPELGIIIEEKGQVKKGKDNFSQSMGRFSKIDYETKFSRTGLNFSSNIMSASMSGGIY